MHAPAWLQSGQNNPKLLWQGASGQWFLTTVGCDPFESRTTLSQGSPKTIQIVTL